MASNFISTKPNGAVGANIYTEAYLHGRLFRCHPDYKKEGPWYDWVMVSWEIANDDAEHAAYRPAADFWSPPMKSRSKKQKPQVPSELVLDLSSHLPEEPTPVAADDSRVIFVPVCLLCFLKDRTTGKPWAVVHPCHSNTTTHSLLTRSWNLIYNDDKTPSVMIIDADTISCHLMVMEESPGLHETKPDSQTVYKISDRKHHWPTIFRKVASSGVENFVPSVAINREKERKRAERTMASKKL